MPRVPSPSHDRGVSIAGNPRITLELEAGGDPIRGTIDRGDGNAQAFWGWLELIEELRRVAAGDREPHSRPSQVTTGLSPEPDAPATRPQNPS